MKRLIIGTPLSRSATKDMLPGACELGAARALAKLAASKVVPLKAI
jgi:hypothetical protein